MVETDIPASAPPSDPRQTTPRRTVTARPSHEETPMKDFLPRTHFSEEHEMFRDMVRGFVEK